MGCFSFVSARLFRSGTFGNLGPTLQKGMQCGFFLADARFLLRNGAFANILSIGDECYFFTAFFIQDFSRQYPELREVRERLDKI